MGLVAGDELLENFGHAHLGHLDGVAFDDAETKQDAEGHLNLISTGRSTRLAGKYAQNFGNPEQLDIFCTVFDVLERTLDLKIKRVI